MEFRNLQTVFFDEQIFKLDKAIFQHVILQLS